MVKSAKLASFVYVANANSDTVSVIETATDKVVETIDCRPEARLPFGSGCNALALDPSGLILYVANGSNNCVAVVRLAGKSVEIDWEFLQRGLDWDIYRLPVPLGTPGKSSLAGLVPTGWYPGAVLVSADGKRLLVANIKGLGSLDEKRAKEKGMNSHDHLGSVSVIKLRPNIYDGKYRPIDTDQLAKYTEEVSTPTTASPKACRVSKNLGPTSSPSPSPSATANPPSSNTSSTSSRKIAPTTKSSAT